MTEDPDDGLLSRVKRAAEEAIKRPIDDPTANLFDAGLVDSLSAVNLLVELEERLGVSLDILEFARREQFTLANIAALVGDAQKKG